MPWSPGFISALDNPELRPRFLVERLRVWNEPGAAWSGASWEGAHGLARIELGGVEVAGQNLKPRGWTGSVGGFTVGLVGDLLPWSRKLVRGTIVRVRMGLGGPGSTRWETVATGQVRNIRGRPPRWRLECLDLFSAARQRLERGLFEPKLFTGIGSTESLTSARTVGATSYPVGSTAGFGRETGGSGAFLVESSSGAYLRKWTAAGPTAFTVDGSSPFMGTTDVGASSGTTIREVAYLEGHPVDIARKVLCSRGSGTNGPWDVLPSAWGLGFSHNLLDHDDIEATKRLLQVPGGYVAQWAQTEPVADAFGWLQGFLAPFGLFLAQRQGRITIRAGMATHRAASRRDSGIHITDSDIDEVLSYEAYDNGHPVEYLDARVFTRGWASTPSTYDAATLPAQPYLDYDLSDRVFENAANVGTELYHRLRESARRIPERLVLRCAGLRLAQAASGDIAFLTTTRAWSRLRGSAGFQRRRVVLDQVSPRLVNSSVDVGLLVYPKDEREGS